jgi:hypothetical protein
MGLHGDSAESATLVPPCSIGPGCRLEVEPGGWLQYRITLLFASLLMLVT